MDTCIAGVTAGNFERNFAGHNETTDLTRENEETMEQRNCSNYPSSRWAAPLGAFFSIVIAGCAGLATAPGDNKVYGDRTSLGDGHVQTYIERNADGSPSAIGLEFPASMLSNLPRQPSDANYCWDKNGDGNISIEANECLATHERILFLPRNEDTPFKWVLLNWNPLGHPPPGIYNVPHFDMHFYLMEYLERNYIRMGPCAPEMVNCEDLKKALVPVPPQFMPADYISMGEQVVAPRMGNHLLDPNSPELLPRPPKGKGKAFTHTFIHGAYDGHIIFYEPMITVAYLQSHPKTCVPIKQPSAHESSGYYPTEYCMRYERSSGNYTVSLEGFEKR